MYLGLPSSTLNTDVLGLCFVLTLLGSLKTVMGFLNTMQFEYFNHFSTEFTAFTESIYWVDLLSLLHLLSQFLLDF